MAKLRTSRWAKGISAFVAAALFLRNLASPHPWEMWGGAAVMTISMIYCAWDWASSGKSPVEKYARPIFLLVVASGASGGWLRYCWPEPSIGVDLAIGEPDSDNHYSYHYEVKNLSDTPVTIDSYQTEDSSGTDNAKPIWGDELILAAHGGQGRITLPPGIFLEKNFQKIHLSVEYESKGGKSRTTDFDFMLSPTDIFPHTLSSTAFKELKNYDQTATLKKEIESRAEGSLVIVLPEKEHGEPNYVTYRVARQSFLFDPWMRLATLKLKMDSGNIVNCAKIIPHRKSEKHIVSISWNYSTGLCDLKIDEGLE